VLESILSLVQQDQEGNSVPVMRADNPDIDQQDDAEQEKQNREEEIRRSQGVEISGDDKSGQQATPATTTARLKKVQRENTDEQVYTPQPKQPPQSQDQP